MGKSGLVRLGDLRAAEQLVQDCRDLGRDPDGWPAVLVAGVARLVDAQVVAYAGGLPEREPAASPGVIQLGDCGWMAGGHRIRWLDRFVHGDALQKSVAFGRFVALPGSLVTRTREQLMDDRAWYRSVELNEEHRPLELDDFLASYARSSDPVRLNGFTINRARGRRRFEARERRLIRVFHGRLHRYFGTALTVPGCPPAQLLPRRLGQTLIRLTAGDSEEEAARSLGVSRPTLHGYVSELYARFGVQSRAELLVRCLGPTPAAEAEPLRIDLPPRLSRTLACLLQGDSEKQAALRLGLSRSTVHGYVSELYVRFGVQSRAELLVRCLRLPDGKLLLSGGMR
jgi:DNA-binding NarL/FixJ family response regulator